ncbi:AMP-dependent synthetase/ligase [Ideonella livida]|uniref:Long-chain fatty acid--CoA ligase n=1 Tax=Ideonella livida TaxID=2707176 RepID=A0A7C9PIL6_9BURK|nr:long-chain fatty acid--CoA ligase [Ideonella livida]NDY92933.1 long-chain fatty acid--CoA ligase [Ideonella livida]
MHVPRPAPAQPADSSSTACAGAVPAGPVGAARTLPALLALRIALTPQGEAYRAYDATAQCWTHLNWQATGARVMRWRRALVAGGLPAQARVAILLPNGLDAMSIDQATLAEGAVPVPLHAIDNPASIAYILADCAASLLVVRERAQWDAICAVGTPLPALQAVIVTEGGVAPTLDLGGHPAAAVPARALADWLQAGEQAAAPLGEGPGPDDLAAIVYTSGTTGKPKGVMLTHRNVLANVQSVLGRVQPTETDRFLSFLPLSHTFERTAGYYLAIAAGSCVAYARSVPQLAEDLVSQQPTVLISVPRIYERVNARITELLAAAPAKARLMALTQAVGWRRFRAAQGLPPDADGAPRWWDALVWPLLQRVVARPVLARFGGRVRVAVSGGAPLPPAIARAFIGLGLPLLQGYGMTETSPVVAANGLTDNDPASVGRPLPGVDVRIGENRELQVRAASVMRGYWNRDEDTARILSPDGWLGTGDQAEIVGGRIHIRGRIKEIIVTSTGEKVPPADLELAITADPLFEQVFVVGENQPFIGAVAVVNAVEWARLATTLGLPAADPASLRHPRVLEVALQRIATQAASFPRYAVPRAVVLSTEPWTIENTMLTPTLKLKRLNLMARFEAELRVMYAPR